MREPSPDPELDDGEGAMEAAASPQPERVRRTYELLETALRDIAEGAALADVRDAQALLSALP